MSAKKPTAGERMIASAKQALAFVAGEDNGCAVHISHTAAELRAKRAESLTDWRKVDAMSDDELEAAIVSDDDERDFVPDWTKAAQHPAK
jgi:hypothetical protein